MGFETIDELKYKMGRARKLYNMIQGGRKFVSIGRAWIPHQIEGKLSIKQTVLLKKALAAPCPYCAGLGRVQCHKCKGTGKIKCPNRKCVNGMVTVEKIGSLVKTSIKHTEKCRICGGRGWMECPECKGVGSVLCEKCNGTGERQFCSKCGGTGLIICSRCHGSGVYKEEVCPYCRGEGVIECSSCHGDGRKK